MMDSHSLIALPVLSRHNCCWDMLLVSCNNMPFFIKCMSLLVCDMNLVA